MKDSPKNQNKICDNNNKNCKTITSLICSFYNNNEPIILNIKKDFTKNSILLKLNIRV